MDFALGFCLGVIAGEGSFSHTSTASGEYPRLSVQLAARDEAMLEHLVAQFGGRIYGPYAAMSGPFITWSINGKLLCDAVPIIKEHMPTCHKRTQMLAWIERHQKYFDNPPKQNLKYQDAEDIRRALRAGVSELELCEIYSVRLGTVRAIKYYNTHLG
jgi:hypothetical protein